MAPGAVALGRSPGYFIRIESIWIVPTALPAVIGTALLVRAGQRDSSPINRILGCAPSFSSAWYRIRFTFGIGRSSFSVNIIWVRALTLTEKAAAVGLMTACAAISWWFVERPFRNKQVPIRRVRCAAGAGAAVLAAAAAAMLGAKGLPGRLSAEAR